MAKGKTHHRRKTMPKISLAVVAGFVPYAKTIVTGYKNGGITNAMNYATKIVGYDGFSKKWGVNYMFDEGQMQGILAGVGVHWAANKLGINRAIGRLGLPISL